jgi:CubicO group peptidase (beta-lactamase class C family)
VKHRSTLVLTTIAAVLVPGGTSAQRAPLDERLLATTVERELTRFAASGAALAVVSRDSVLLLRAFGRTRHEGGQRVTADLPFGTVALRDVFTALAAARLAQEGRVDLDAPVGIYAPDLPPRVGSVTLAQLLSHTAGLDDARAEPARRPRSAVWPEATDRALFTEPGAIHSRSRHGLPLVRGVLAARTAQADSTLVRTLVAEPAGMQRTTHDPMRAQEFGAAAGIVMSTSGARPIVALAPAENAYPHLYTTTRDLAGLLRRLLGGFSGAAPDPLHAAFETVSRARAPVPATGADSVGLGVRITEMHGHRTIVLAAGEAGYGVLLHVLPEPGIALVVVANATGAVLRESADVLLDALLGEPSATAEAAARPDSVLPQEPAGRPGAELPQEPAGFAGTYVNGDRFVVLETTPDGLVWRDGDLALQVRRTGARLQAIIGDGRVAQTFHLVRDAAGRAYLFIDGVALRREEAARR